jgi:ankyrin repeat protein
LTLNRVICQLLDIAVLRDAPESVRLLLDAGADPDSPDRDGSTARSMAEKSADPQIRAMLAAAVSRPTTAPAGP